MTKILIYILSFYKSFISPVVQGLFGGACRFTPTCSEYTIGAVKRFGAVKGTILGIKRFSRCHPMGESGYDPVPEI